MDNAPRRLPLPMVVVALFPLLAAAVSLGKELANRGSMETVWPLDTLWLPVVVVVVTLGLILAAHTRSPLRAELGALGLLVPCFCAPLAVLYPWAVVPSQIPDGIGVGGFGFFLTWLTKYPSWGPFNPEVLLGIACVLGAAVMPVSFAAYAARSSAPRQRVLAALFVLYLVAFVPVLLRLDLLSWVMAAGSPEGWVLGSGPLLRTLPLGFMLYRLLRPPVSAPRASSA